jgi:chemotaxis protein CheZ
MNEAAERAAPTFPPGDTLAAKGGHEAVYEQLGHVTRQLHEALRQLGVMPRLEAAADGLPDVKSRLFYVADKTRAAAEKVLGAVDEAKAEQRRIMQATAELEIALLHGRESVRPALVAAVRESSARTDALLTDIMLAQDFHDLTGQVIARIVGLASDLEASLLQMLVRAAPRDALARADAALPGPAVAGVAQGDMVSSQAEVDDLLATLGF